MLGFVALLLASYATWCEAKCDLAGQASNRELLASSTTCKGRDRTFAFNPAWEVRTTGRYSRQGDTDTAVQDSQGRTPDRKIMQRNWQSRTTTTVGLEV